MDQDPGGPPSAQAFPGAKLRPARSLRVALGLSGFWALLVTATCIGLPELRAVMGGFGAMMFALLSAGLYRLHKHSPRGGGQIEIRGGDVYVEGRLALPRGTVERAVVARDARGANVSLQRKQGLSSVIDVGSDAEGQALVKALRLDAAQALSTFLFDSPLTAKLPRWGLYLYILLLAPLLFLPLFFGVDWMAILLGLAWYLPLLGSTMPTQLSIGLDGLLVRWLWGKKLVRFEDLRSIEHNGERLSLKLADGNHLSLAVQLVGSPFKKLDVGDRGFASKADYLDAVVARAREALAASRKAEHFPAAALLRQGRAIDAWVRSLRGALRGNAKGFREAEAVPEQLWGTVEDGGADPSARAAAAVALGPTLDAAARERMRGVARVVVSPRLRVALEVAADHDGTEESVREALAELEDEREARRAR